MELEPNRGDARIDTLRSPARFVGTHPARMDAKGRVCVPVDLRRALDPAAMADAIDLFPSLTGPEVLCGGRDLVEVVLHAVETLDVLQASFSELKLQVTADIIRLPFDDAGRMIVPADLRLHAGLTTDVSFAGRGPYFVLAPTDYLQAQRLRARTLTDDQRQVVQARSLPNSLTRRGGGS